MIIALVVALLVAVLLVGILLGYALRQRQDLAQKDIDIEVLEHSLGKEKQVVEFLKNDVALLEDNVDIARSEARAHERTITMLLEEVARADDASA
jgi:cell division protein FtsB